MGSFTINGGINVSRIHVENRASITENIDKYLTEINELGLSDDIWKDSSVVLANMNLSLSGNGQDYQFNGIKRFKVYKTIGTADKKLHLIYETNSVNERIIKDYVVGDLCQYQYYISPICADEENADLEQAVQPFYSDPITIDSGHLIVAGLIQTSENTFEVDTSNIWKFWLNITDNGTTLNTNKTFNDTQNQYQQATGSHRGYKSKNITALLGDIDCTSKDFIDNYEKLEAWDDFCKNCSLKVLVDLRGRILIGDIDNNPNIEYGTSITREASVSFSFKELDSLENIAILGEGIAVSDATDIEETEMPVPIYSLPDVAEVVS